jgi:hypothetical protein
MEKMAGFGPLITIGIFSATLSNIGQKRHVKNVISTNLVLRP